MLRFFFKTIAQIGDRPFRSAVYQGSLVSIAILVALGVGLAGMAVLASVFSQIVGIDWGTREYVGLVAALFIPAAALAIGFFVDPVASAVEEKHYPKAPRPDPRPIWTDLGIAARYASLALVVNLILLPLYWFAPPILAIINGFLLGREYFDLSARRRHTRSETRRLRKSVITESWIAGALLAVLTSVPGLNLLAPVFGIALMTHVYHWSARERIVIH